MVYETDKKLFKERPYYKKQSRLKSFVPSTNVEPRDRRGSTLCGQVGTHVTQVGG